LPSASGMPAKLGSDPVSLSPTSAHLYAAIRQHFPAFVAKVIQTGRPGVEYQHNWDIEAIGKALEECGLGQTTRLIINAPPRHLKSTCASVAYPALVLGQYPSA